MFNNIVVAVDGSEASARVLAVACDLAKNMAAKLTIVHSPQPETTTLAIGAVAGLHAAMAMPGKEEIEAAGQQVLDSALTQAKGFGMDEVNSVMRRGEAADEVVAEAKARDADLIISGRRGLGGLTSFVLGSTSQRIGHLATCSCLTVA